MVLKGAEALAIPTKMGQKLEFQPDDSKTLKWESWDNKNLLWFSASMDIPDFSISNTNNPVSYTHLTLPTILLV